MKYFCTSIVFFFVLTKMSTAMCPSICQCFDETLEASCTNGGLDVVPIQLNPEIQTIVLRENRISNVHYTLSFYTELRNLDLSMNKIKILGSHNFEFQTKLLSLNVSYNEIAVLSKDTFKGLKNLKTLDLSHNRISAINETAFRDTLCLELLFLSFNNISYFEDPQIFSSLNSLRILKLDNNQILDVPNNVLSNLPFQTLNFLYLNENLIDVLEDDSFPLTLKNLQTLSLSSNIISLISESSFVSLRTLHTLDLSSNNLSVIPTKQLSKLSNLVHLDLSGNNFSNIDKIAFQSLFNLKSVIINFIPTLAFIDHRAFVDNVQLETVILNENINLKELPDMLFQGNTNLKHVSLRGNSLRNLEALNFPFERISFLDLSDNPLHCDCNLLWLWLLVQLQIENAMKNTTQGFEAGLNTSMSTQTLMSKTEEAHRINQMIKSKHSLTVVSSNLRCFSPPDIKGQEVESVPENHVKCENNTIMYILSLSLFFASSVVISLLMYHNRASWKTKIHRNLNQQGNFVNNNCLNSNATTKLMFCPTNESQYDQNKKLTNEGFPGSEHLYGEYTGKHSPSFNGSHIHEEEPLSTKKHYHILDGTIPKSDIKYYPRKIPKKNELKSHVSQSNIRDYFQGNFSSTENFHKPPSTSNLSFERKAPSFQDIQYFDQWKKHSTGVYNMDTQYLNVALENNGPNRSEEHRLDVSKSLHFDKKQDSPNIVYV